MALREQTTPRLLNKGYDIFANDTLLTDNSSSLQIQLYHNKAILSLGAHKVRRLYDSTGWRAAKGSEVNDTATNDSIDPVDDVDLTKPPAKTGSVEIRQLTVGVMGKKEEPRATGYFAMERREDVERRRSTGDLLSDVLRRCTKATRGMRAVVVFVICAGSVVVTITPETTATRALATCADDTKRWSKVLGERLATTKIIQFTVKN